MERRLSITLTFSRMHVCGFFFFSIMGDHSTHSGPVTYPTTYIYVFLRITFGPVLTTMFPRNSLYYFHVIVRMLGGRRSLQLLPMPPPLTPLLPSLPPSCFCLFSVFFCSLFVFFCLFCSGARRHRGPSARGGMRPGRRRQGDLNFGNHAYIYQYVPLQ